MMFPAKSVPRSCPVEGYSGRAATQTEMRVYFWHRHVRDTVVILGEGKLPHPRCPLWGILVPWRSLNRIHWHKKQFSKGEYWKRRRLAVEGERLVASRAFSAYGRPLEMVTSF